MSSDANNATFIPTNYPKSFVIAICAVLSGLAAGGVAFFGHWIESAVLATIAQVLFFTCWGVAAIMFMIFLPNTWAGKYRNLPARPWREQVW